MDKKSFGSGAGIGGVIAVIITVLCHVMDNGAIP